MNGETLGIAFQLSMNEPFYLRVHMVNDINIKFNRPIHTVDDLQYVGSKTHSDVNSGRTEVKIV